MPHGRREAPAHVRTEFPSCQVIVLTTFDDDDEVFVALRQIAALPVKARSGIRAEAIRAAAVACLFCNPPLPPRSWRTSTAFSSPSITPCRLWLTVVGSRVRGLRQLAAGKSNQEIAVPLSLAEARSRIISATSSASSACSTHPGGPHARDLGLIYGGIWRDDFWHITTMPASVNVYGEVWVTT